MFPILTMRARYPCDGERSGHGKRRPAAVGAWYGGDGARMIVAGDDDKGHRGIGPLRAAGCVRVVMRAMCSRSGGHWGREACTRSHRLRF